MKKVFFNLLTVVSVGLLISACSNPSKMIDAADQVQKSCDPQVLEAKADVIDARYTLTFPAKYFHKKAVLEVIPVLVYEGGEETGTSKWLQGENVSSNYTTIPQTGGSASQAVQFKYKEGMQSAHLELRVKLHYKNKATDFPSPFKLADGTIITYKLVDAGGEPVLAPNAYQPTYTETQEAQIKYQIQSAAVRSSELSKADVKALKTFLEEANKNERKQIAGTNIVAYASPDGPEQLNTKLSSDRSKTAKSALDNATRKIKNKGAVNLSTISEDWEGFSELVAASTIQDKDLILRVLSMYNDPVVREREIKNMSKVYQVLADKVLPELRRASLVANVTVQNYTDQELSDLVAQNNVEGLDVEALLHAATLVADNATKASLYEKAGEKFGDWRAYNNLAYVRLAEGKLADAKAALAKVTTANDIVKNNNGVVALREGRTADAEKLFTEAGRLPAATQNAAVIAILKGNYPDAVSKLASSNSFNAALANVLVQNYSKASDILKNVTTAKASYLKAVIAARNGNGSQVASELKDAYAKDASLKARAQKDIEFAKFQSNI
jgi:outer membrane protein OmpA-like peptidoglycan-associated protein